MSSFDVVLEPASFLQFCPDSDSSSLPSLFKGIPPERIGLQGEYDHHGLAKRVKAALELQFGSDLLRNLRVHQRGKVVIFMGELPNATLLKQLVHVALAIEGATAVETLGVCCQSSTRWDQPAG